MNHKVGYLHIRKKPHDEELSNEEFSFTFNGKSATNVQAFTGAAEICVGAPSPSSQATPSSTASTLSTTSLSAVIPNNCVEVPNVPRCILKFKILTLI